MASRTGWARTSFVTATVTSARGCAVRHTAPVASRRISSHLVSSRLISSHILSYPLPSPPLISAHDLSSQVRHTAPVASSMLTAACMTVGGRLQAAARHPARREAAIRLTALWAVVVVARRPPHAVWPTTTSSRSRVVRPSMVMDGSRAQVKELSDPPTGPTTSLAHHPWSPSVLWPVERAMRGSGLASPLLFSSHPVAPLPYSAGGESYEGQWRHGVRHGHGRSSHPSGEWYDGFWNEGQRHVTGDRTHDLC
jgi:hypothetical protein